MEPSDRELVERVRGGDVEAYRGLVQRHYSGCLRYALRMLGNRADAEEAVQDAFARGYRFLPSFDIERRFDGWLFRILVNRCRSLLASRMRGEQVFVPYEASDFETAASGSDEPELHLELRRALDTLRPVHREALLLKYLDDRTYEEMAELTGTRVSALKMRVKRARAELETLLRGVRDVI